MVVADSEKFQYPSRCTMRLDGRMGKNRIGLTLYLRFPFGPCVDSRRRI